MEKIDFDKFYKVYDVRRNPIRSLAPYENTMLDYDDEELDYLTEQDERKVWSLNNDFVLKPGLHYNNSIGYFVARKEWIDKDLNYLLI